MRTKLYKILAATFVLAIASNAFAEESSSEGFRLGFYGSLPDGGMNVFTEGGTVGVLFDLGNRVELGLGIGLISDSRTTETNIGNTTNKTENGASGWEIIPSGSYTLSKGDIISYGAGLNIYFASSSTTQTANGTTTTVKPDGIDLAFLPNFFVKAEVTKNFAIGIRPGFLIAIPGKIENGQTTTSRTIIGLGTELFLALYI